MSSSSHRTPPSSPSPPSSPAAFDIFLEDDECPASPAAAATAVAAAVATAASPEASSSSTVAGTSSNAVANDAHIHVATTSNTAAAAAAVSTVNIGDAKLLCTHITYDGLTAHFDADEVPYFKTNEIQNNVQEIVGVTPACLCHPNYQTWYVTKKSRDLAGVNNIDKALYRLAFDFDIAETEPDAVVACVSALLSGLSQRWVPISSNLDEILVAYLTRKSSQRWHAQVLNVSFAARDVKAGNTIIKEIKETIYADAKAVLTETGNEKAMAVLNNLDMIAGNNQWLMYGSRKGKKVPDYYKLAFIASHDPEDGNEYVGNRDTSWNDEHAFKIRRALSMHRTPLEEVFGSEVCIDYESGDVYKCRTMPGCLKLGDDSEVKKALNLLEQERDLLDAVEESGGEEEDDDETIQQLVQSLRAKRNKKKRAGGDDDDDDDDDDGYEDREEEEDNNINNALAEQEEQDLEEEYEMDKDDSCNRRSITAQAIEDAQRSPAGFLRFVNSVYDEETELQNAKDTKLGRSKRTVINSYDKCIELAKQYKRPLRRNNKTDLQRRAITLAIVKLVFQFQYAVHYIRWFTKLTPLIVSNMGYSGMSLYRVLCTNVCAGNIGDDAGIAFNRCVQYLFECSPQQTEDGKSMVVMPRAVYRPKFEPPFQMSPEEKTDAKWIIQTYAQCNFLCVPFFIKYVFYLVSQGKCVLIHDTSDDKYETLKYNKDMGIYQTDNVINLILPLQTLIFKTILHNLTCKDPNSPLDLLFKLYDGLATLINQQKPIKLDANPSETERHKCSLSKEYLVFSNGTTFNCETSQFEKWGEHQICMRRVGLDIDYGATELTEHATVEIHPLRGGVEYLYKVFRMFILYALKVINRSHLTAFSRHKPAVNTMSPWKGIFAMFSPAESAQLEALQEEYVRDRENTSPETVRRLREAYNLGCIYHMVTTFLMVRPDLYVELIDSGELGVDMDNMEVDDDGGPVVIVRRKMSYEDKMLAMMDGIFGGRERTNIVLRFLAIGLRTGGTGRNALYLHGEAMNGKSAFMNVLSAGMGGEQSQMVIHLPGEYFTNRGSNQMDASFKDCNRDARFLYVPEIAISEMGPTGRRKFKRLTGGDVIADRVPYGKKNILYVNNAKFIASSNDIPYFTEAETAEISRFLIIPMRSFFNTSIAAVRSTHLRQAINERATYKLFRVDNAYPALFTTYVQNCNTYANEMFGEVAVGLKVMDSILGTCPPITRQYTPPKMKNVPPCRQMLGDKKILDEDEQKKLGAGLMRLLTRRIIPSMGGITQETVEKCTKEFDTLTRYFHSQLTTYKDMMHAVIVSKIVRVCDEMCFVNVEDLRNIASADYANIKKTYAEAMYGKYYSNNSAMDNIVSSALEDLPRFVTALMKIGLNCTKYKDPKEEVPRGTVVIYGYLLIEHFNAKVARAVKNQEVLHAITDDSHFAQYGSILEDEEAKGNEDEYMRRHFMKPVVGAESYYGSHYEDHSGIEMNNTYNAIISDDHFENALLNYDREEMNKIKQKRSRMPPANAPAAPAATPRKKKNGSKE